MYYHQYNGKVNGKHNSTRSENFITSTEYISTKTMDILTVQGLLIQSIAGDYPHGSEEIPAQILIIYQFYTTPFARDIIINSVQSTNTRQYWMSTISPNGYMIDIVLLHNGLLNSILTCCWCIRRFTRRCWRPTSITSIIW